VRLLLAPGHAGTRIVGLNIVQEAAGGVSGAADGPHGVGDSVASRTESVLHDLGATDDGSPEQHARTEDVDREPLEPEFAATPQTPADAPARDGDHFLAALLPLALPLQVVQFFLFLFLLPRLLLELLPLLDEVIQLVILAGFDDIVKQMAGGFHRHLVLRLEVIEDLHPHLHREFILGPLLPILPIHIRRSTEPKHCWLFLRECLSVFFFSQTLLNAT